MSKIGKKSSLEGVILAGGKSQQMGLDKTKFRVARDLNISSRVIKVVYRTEYGPFGGIETALRRAKMRRHGRFSILPEARSITLSRTAHSDRTQMENVNTPEQLTAARARLQ